MDNSPTPSSRLLETVTAMPVRTAAIAFAVTVTYQVGLLTVFTIAMTDGPFAGVGTFLGQTLPSVMVVAAMAGLFAYFAVIVGETARSRQAQMAFKVCLLSPVPMVVPTTVYAVFLYARMLVLPPYNWGVSVLPDWVRGVLVVLGSGWWLFAILLGWLALWYWAGRQVDQYMRAVAPQVCHHCGHDLRGTSNSATCPACGAPVLAPGTVE